MVEGAPKEGAPKEGTPKEGAPKEGAPKEGALEAEVVVEVVGPCEAVAAVVAGRFGVSGLEREQGTSLVGGMAWLAF